MYLRIGMASETSIVQILGQMMRIGMDIIMGGHQGQKGFKT